MERWWDGGEWSRVTRPAPEGARYPPAWRQVAAATAGTARATPVRAGIVATPDGVPLARLGARLGARLIDGVIVTLSTAFIGSPYLARADGAMTRWLDAAERAAVTSNPAPDPLALYTDPDFWQPLIALAVIGELLGLLYTVGFLRWRGATIGKSLAGVRVRPWLFEDAGTPGLSWRRALLRWLTGEFIGGVPMLGSWYKVVDYLWPTWDPRRQALHDKLPGTVVVRSRP